MNDEEFLDKVMSGKATFTNIGLARLQDTIGRLRSQLQAEREKSAFKLKDAEESAEQAEAALEVEKEESAKAREERESAWSAMAQARGEVAALEAKLSASEKSLDDLHAKYLRSEGDHVDEMRELKQSLDECEAAALKLEKDSPCHLCGGKKKTSVCGKHNAYWTTLSGSCMPCANEAKVAALEARVKELEADNSICAKGYCLVHKGYVSNKCPDCIQSKLVASEKSLAAAQESRDNEWWKAFEDAGFNVDDALRVSKALPPSRSLEEPK